MYVGFPTGSVGKESACNAGDAGEAGSIPGSGRSLGGGYSNSLQYSCMENPMSRGAWQAYIVHGVAKSWTWLNEHALTCIMYYKDYGCRQVLRCLQNESANWRPRRADGVALTWGQRHENQKNQWFHSCLKASRFKTLGRADVSIWV